MDTRTRHPSLPPLEREAAASACQPGLFPPGSIEERPADPCESLGVFSGEGLYRRDPARYREIVRAIGEGLGIRQIARAWKVSPHTIMAIREREGAGIATHKAELASLATLGARMGIERLIEEMDSLKRESLPVAIGILTDKALLLSGEATSRVERIDGGGAGDFAAALAAAKRAKGRTIEAEEITGRSGDTDGTKGAPAGPAALAGPDGRPDLRSLGLGAGAILDGATDSESDACPLSGGASGEHGHGQGHVCQRRELPDQAAGHEDAGRGGGGPARAVAPKSPLDSARENFAAKEDHEHE